MCGNEFGNIYESQKSYVDGGCFEQISDLPVFTRYRVCHGFGEGSRIITELWIPDDWNGIFVGIGNGGLAGGISHPELAAYTKRGYAAAHTDMGTGNLSARGGLKLEIVKDFGWRATHAMTVLAKTLLSEHCKKSPEFSYFIGFSTGGQQALSEAQRFPLDYDGISAGVPANNRVALHTHFLWNHLALTENGKGRFTKAEADALSALAVRFFQMNGDGQKGDDFITFPWLGADTVPRFIEFLKENSEFSSSQINALEKVYSGAVDPVSGKRIYNGMPIGSEKYGSGVAKYDGVCPHFYPFSYTFGQDYTGQGFDFSADFESVRAKLSAELDANKADLSALKANGGKLIMFSGSADPCVPFPDAMRYCERVNENHGGYESTSDFYRYFLIPGRDHGFGGDGANALHEKENGYGDLLTALRSWREDGNAPDSLIATRYKDDTRIWERAVYPYLSKEFPKTDYPPTCDDSFLS